MIACNNSLYFKFENLERYREIIHFSTSRNGGISDYPYNTLNIGYNTDDAYHNVTENRRRLGEATNISPKQMIFPAQTHSNNILYITEVNGPIDNSLYSNTDGMITTLPGICLCVQTADCAPVLLFDPVKDVIAVAHAGWRGVVKNITRHVVNAMVTDFSCGPQNIIAGIGPAIGADVYEVGTNVIDGLAETFSDTHQILTYQSPDKALFNVKKANRLLLNSAGIPDSNINISSYCTFTHSDMFFSARRDNGVTGRMASGIMLKDGTRN